MEIVVYILCGLLVIFVGLVEGFERVRAHLFQIDQATAEYVYRSHISCGLNAKVHFCVGWVRHGVAAEVYISTARREIGKMEKMLFN